MTREDRAWEAYAQVMREQAPAGKYAARSLLDAPSEQDKRAVAAMLAFADAEAAAMRERADKVFTECVVDQSMRTGTQPRDYQSPGQWRDATRRAAIRALPATGEVGRG